MSIRSRRWKRIRHARPLSVVLSAFAALVAVFAAAYSINLLIHH
ncbi:hypothetical protein [Variovorax sp. GT1P44]